MFWLHYMANDSVCVSVCVLCHVSVTPWAYQVPLSMEFSQQEYWNELPFPPPGDLPNLGIKPISPVLVGRFFTGVTTWKV